MSIMTKTGERPVVPRSTGLLRSINNSAHMRIMIELDLGSQNQLIISVLVDFSTAGVNSSNESNHDFHWLIVRKEPCINRFQNYKRK